MKEGKEYGRKQEFKAEIPILLKKNRFCSNKKLHEIIRKKHMKIVKELSKQRLFLIKNVPHLLDHPNRNLYLQSLYLFSSLIVHILHMPHLANYQSLYLLEMFVCN